MDAMNVWSSPLFEDMPWLAHGTATRAFGSTRYPNAGEGDATSENRARFFGMFGLDAARVAMSGNVHGNRVVDVAAGTSGLVTDCDGLVTSVPCLALATKTADCLPLFFVDPVLRMVGIAHAGWKGVAAGIAMEAVRALARRGSRPSDLLVAVGPSVGPCHYEIGAPRRDDMLSRTPFVEPPDFSSVGFPYRAGSRPGDDEEKFMADLRAMVVRQLRAAGVGSDHIDASAPCTACRPDLFFSYTLVRDPSLGMLSAIAVIQGQR